MSFAANLTPDKVTGLGIGTEQMFIARGEAHGHVPDDLAPMPWQDFKNLTDEDLQAIFTYLETIPPIKHQVPDPIPPQK